MVKGPFFFRATTPLLAFSVFLLPFLPLILLLYPSDWVSEIRLLELIPYLFTLFSDSLSLDLQSIICRPPSQLLRSEQPHRTPSPPLLPPPIVPPLPTSNLLLQSQKISTTSLHLMQQESSPITLRFTSLSDGRIRRPTFDSQIRSRKLLEVLLVWDTVTRWTRGMMSG